MARAIKNHKKINQIKSPDVEGVCSRQCSSQLEASGDFFKEIK